MRKIFPGADVEIPAGDETLIVSRADPTDVSSHFNEHSLAAAQMPCRDSNRLELEGRQISQCRSRGVRKTFH